MRYVLLFILLGLQAAVDAQADRSITNYRYVMDSCRRTSDPVAAFKEVLAPQLARRLREGPVDSTLADHYHRVSIYLKAYDPNFVKSYADKAIELRVLVKDKLDNIAQSYYERGVLQTRMGHHQSAFRDLQVAVTKMSTAITAQDSTQNLARRLGYFLVEAAISAKENGNYPLAHLWLQQTPPLLNIYYNPKAEFGAKLTQADTYQRQGRFNEAIQTYRQATSLTYLSQSPFKNDRMAVYANWGITHNRNKQPLLAEVQLKKALEIYYEEEGVGSPINAASNFSGLIRSMNLQGRYGEVDALLTKGLSEAHLVYTDRKGPVIGELYARAANTASFQNNFPRVDSLLRLSAESLLANPRFQEANGLPIMEGSTIYGQQDMLEMLTARRDAYVRAYEQNVQVDGLELALATSHSIDTLLRLNRDQLNLTASLGQFINLEAAQYTTAIDLALRLYRTTANEAYLNEAYQFASSQKSNLLRRYLTSPGLAAGMGVPDAIIDKKSALDLAVLTTEKALQNAAPQEKSIFRDSLLRLNTEVDQLKRELTKDYPAFSRALRGFAPVDPVTASASLDPDQLVVEYFVSADSIYLFTLCNGEGLKVITQPLPDDLRLRIADVVDQRPGSRSLYDLLVAPVLEGRPQIERLQFIPDGDLWSLPFGALRTPNDRFLIQEQAVSFAYAAPLLFDANLSSQATSAAERYLGYGISYVDILRGISTDGNRSAEATDLRSMGQLPWAGREVEEAADIMKGASRLNEEATKQRFIDEGGSASILHLSMHGLLRPNPLESALVFRGDNDNFDLLTMAEVLAGSYPTELAVLSACHTGGGPLQTSEGMQTIGRAFTAAGTRATITSTWEARDETTYTILTNFYRALAEGKAKDVALQESINQYLLDGTSADRSPINWANLTLTGLVKPLESRTNWPLILFGLLAVTGLLVWSLRRKG
ncbi:MAG: CHAT domain-containing protein [Lewinella sp.]